MNRSTNSSSKYLINSLNYSNSQGAIPLNFTLYNKQHRQDHQDYGSITNSKNVLSKLNIKSRHRNKHFHNLSEQVSSTNKKCENNFKYFRMLSPISHAKKSLQSTFSIFFPNRENNFEKKIDKVLLISFQSRSKSFTLPGKE